MPARNVPGRWSRTRELAVQNEPRLIAIVDDDELVREATKGLIRSMGLAAEAFPSGEDFLRSPHLTRTTCLVTDVNMPGMSGLDLHHRVAAMPKRIPTILITAYPSDSIRDRALSAGIICYLVKPFSEDELLNCIGTAMSPETDGGGARSPKRNQ
jgi:FixJ family two-component response regulator